MKNKITKYLTLGATCLALFAAPSDSSKPQIRTLAWDDTNSIPIANIGFNIYTTTNVLTPISQWTLMTNLWATNLTSKTSGVTNTFSFSFLQVPQLQFFVATTIDPFYGESDFSNVTNTPAPMRPPRNLRAN